MKTEKKPQLDVWQNQPINLSFKRIYKFLVLLFTIFIFTQSIGTAQEMWRVDLNQQQNSIINHMITNKNGYTFRLDIGEDTSSDPWIYYYLLECYTPEGDLAWYKNFNLNELKYSSLDVDSYDNVYIFGTFLVSSYHFGSRFRKYSISGDLIVNLEFPAPANESGGIARSIQGVDNEGNLIMVGQRMVLGNFCDDNSYFYLNSSIQQASSGGAINWISDFGTETKSVYYGPVIEGFDDEGGILASYSLRNDNCNPQSDGEEFIVKIDKNGNKIWTHPKPVGSVFYQPSGNLYNTAGNGWFSDSYFITKRDTGFNVVWTIDFSDYISSVIENHKDGGALVIFGGSIPVYLNSDGTIRWTSSRYYGGIKIGPDGNIYSTNNGNIYCTNPTTGEDIWTYSGAINNAKGIFVDKNNAVYLYSNTELAKYEGPDYLTIRDANNDTIPNTEFDLIRIEDNPPIFTEEYLGKFTTDSDGRLELLSEGVDTFSVELDEGTKNLISGDMIKVTKHVHSESAIKHPSLLGIMYSVHLDNIKFDNQGAVTFNTVGEDNWTEVVLDHTELRYNLVASVQWDATTEYLSSLAQGFSYLSDYLYDVYDGQVRLDTVMIFDDEEHWLEADIRIFSSNTEWPRAYAGGIEDGMAARSIFFPRKFYYSRNNANDSYLEYPYDLSDADNYRTMGHEFGHYAMNFFDEYSFIGSDSTFTQTLRCATHNNDSYGYMDNQYVANGPTASELSNTFDYSDMNCRNTQQYYFNGMSCWDYFRQQIEGYYGDDNIWVPISIPGDAVRTLPVGYDYFPGPNDDELYPDYYVGFHTIFPIEHTGPTSFDLDVVAHDATTLNRMGGVEVTLLKERAPGNWYAIPQGKTSAPDASGTSGGGIFVLGSETGDRIRMVSDYTIMGIAGLRSAVLDETDKWMCGETTVENSSAISISMQTVDGYYPAICDASLSEEETEFYLRMPQPFNDLPEVSLNVENKVLSSSLQVTSFGYSATVSDSIGTTGRVTYTTIDNSSHNFFFDNSYMITEFSDTSSQAKIAFGYNGRAELIADNTSKLERVMLLNSPYIVPRTGLESISIQAGDAISVSTMPSTSLAEGATLIIRYDDIDLQLIGGKGDETNLSVYNWDNVESKWILIGGTPDTDRDMIMVPINAPGVYAVFTNSIITSIEEKHGLNPTDKFNLSDNYPNPFNQATTIEFSLPQTSEIKLDILNINGQLVRTLVESTFETGSHKVEWNSRDNKGNQVSPGIYLYRLTVDEFTKTKNMILLK